MSLCRDDFLGMADPTVFLSADPGYDYLSAVEFGRVLDSQPPNCWQRLSEDFAYWRPPRARKARGFHVRRFSDFDVDDPEVAEIWTGRRFTVPLLGLPSATTGEIIVAARAYLGGEPTLNRSYFELATRATGEHALHAWRCCLETGDGMAHFALGYTLYELERFHEAYGHLRHYAELAPHSAWNWCWLAKGAAAIGETAEARRACKRAIELSEAGDDETDAPDLLAELTGS
jgi:tetratricopeptide (TPR) repeat protein